MNECFSKEFDDLPKEIHCNVLSYLTTFDENFLSKQENNVQNKIITKKLLLKNIGIQKRKLRKHIFTKRCYTCRGTIVYKMFGRSYLFHKPYSLARICTYCKQQNDILLYQENVDKKRYYYSYIGENSTIMKFVTAAFAEKAYINQEDLDFFLLIIQKNNMCCIILLNEKINNKPFKLAELYIKSYFLKNTNNKIIKGSVVILSELYGFIFIVIYISLCISLIYNYLTKKIKYLDYYKIGPFNILCEILCRLNFNDMILKNQTDLIAIITLVTKIHGKWKEDKKCKIFDSILKFMDILKKILYERTKNKMQSLVIDGEKIKYKYYNDIISLYIFTKKDNMKQLIDVFQIIWDVFRTIWGVSKLFVFRICTITIVKYCIQIFIMKCNNFFPKLELLIRIVLGVVFFLIQNYCQKNILHRLYGGKHKVLIF